MFAFFRSDAEVMHGHGANREHVTKKEARETWPELLQSFPTVEYYNPKMEITENNAVVYYEITTDGFYLKGTQHLVKENGRWLITKFTYED